MDTRDTPEYDYKRSLIKGLDVVRQCAALLERRVQSGTRVRKAQAVTRQTNPIGRSMIEMLGVLAIIGVLSVGGIAGYSKAMTKFKTNTLLQQISIIISNTQILYAQQKNHKDFNEETAIQMGIIPAELISSDGKTLVDSFGDELGLVEEDGEDLNIITFTSEISTKEKCLAMFNADWNVFNPYAIIAMSYNGKSLGYCSDKYLEIHEEGGICGINDEKVAEKLPFSPSDAAEICSFCSAEEPCYFILGLTTD